MKQEVSRRKQSHTHEFTASTQFAETGNERHNHRIAGVTSQAIKVSGGHIHTVKTNTAFFKDHLHRVNRRTGLPINIGKGKHIHRVMGRTTVSDGHSHRLFFATLIQG